MGGLLIIIAPSEASGGVLALWVSWLSQYSLMEIKTALGEEKQHDLPKKMF